jgi:hypothetical protein
LKALAKKHRFADTAKSMPVMIGFDLRPGRSGTGDAVTPAIFLDF